MREKAAVEWFKDRDHDKSFVNIRKRVGSLTVLASLEIPFWARLRPA